MHGETSMDQEQAEKAIKTAWSAGIISGVLTLIVTIVAMAGHSFMGFSALNLLDVAMIAGLTFGIYRKSRTCAVLMLVYFIGSKLLIWSETKSAAGLPMALIFSWFFYQGIRGTFAWHGLNAGADRPAPQNAIPGPVPKFKTREEYQAWKEQRGRAGSAASAGSGSGAAKSGGIAAWVVAIMVLAGATWFMTSDVRRSLLSSNTVPAAWQEFSSVDGNFAVLMPGTPSYEKKSQSTALGPIDMHMFNLNIRRDAAYMIMYSDYPEIVTKAKPDDLLDGGRNGALSNTKGKLIGEQNMSLDGFPGREIVIEVPGKGIMKLRAFMVRQRLFQVIAVGTKEKIDHEDTIKYLTSFRLLAR
jgi:serine/threonine-protein kinase